MALWDRLRARELNSRDQANAIAPLRSYLQRNKHLSAEVQTFLATSNDLVFLSEVVNPIFWDTGQLPFSEIEKEIHRILSQRERPISDPLEVQQISTAFGERLWIFSLQIPSVRLPVPIWKTSCLKRRQRRADRTMLNQMASDWSLAKN